MIRDKFGVAELKPTGTQPWQSASVVSIFCRNPLRDGLCSLNRGAFLC
jgi:hypothetical protein